MSLFSWDIISQVLTPTTFLWMAIGTLVGLLIGSLPGLGPSLGIALMLPFTLYLTPLQAVIMLVCLYMSVEYGGSIASIAIGVPGTGAAVVTMFDGQPMAKKGQPGRALGLSLTASTVGGIFGVLVLMFGTSLVSAIVYNLTDPELTTIALFGVLSIAYIGSKDVPKTLMSVLIGLLIGTVGIDPFTAAPRFTMGNYNLYDGFALVPVVIGLYAVPSILNMLSAKETSKRVKLESKDLNTHLEKGDFKKCFPSMMYGGIIGAIIGIIPGLGGGPATFLSYNTLKSRGKNKETFGTGDPRGITVCESANNAVVGGALLPFLTLGIAGSPAVAVVGSAFIQQGIEPGVALMRSTPELVYGIMWGLLFGCVMMYIFGKLATSLFARLLVIPNSLMAPLLTFFVLTGAFVSRYLPADVWIALIIGVIAFFISKLGFSLPCIIVSLVLSEILEGSFRRSLILSKGDWSIFVRDGICLFFIGLSVAVVGGILISNARKARKKAQAATDDSAERA